MLLCYWGHWKIPLRVLKNMFILWEFSFPDSNTWTCWEGNTTDKISLCCFDPDHRRLKKILQRYCALFVTNLELVEKHWRMYLSWCFSFRNSTGFAERGEDRRTVMTSLERERCRDEEGREDHSSGSCVEQPYAHIRACDSMAESPWGPFMPCPQVWGGEGECEYYAHWQMGVEPEGGSSLSLYLSVR